MQNKGPEGVVVVDFLQSVLCTKAPHKLQCSLGASLCKHSVYVYVQWKCKLKENIGMIPKTCYN